MSNSGFAIVPSHEIETRDEFATLCNWRRHLWAIEIGTDQAVFACKFLREWRGREMFCVDPFQPYSEKDWDRESDYLVAGSRLQSCGFDGSVRLVRETSEGFFNALNRAVGPEHPRFFDFIYIDGSHDYEAVIGDIRRWWEKLYPIGILAGHDFDTSHPGVVRAVEEFAREKNLRVYVTTGDDPASWYIYKNEPGPDWVRIDTSAKDE